MTTHTLKAALTLAIITLLTGCVSLSAQTAPKPIYAGSFPIDNSHQALGKSSRAEFIILHYTAEDHDGSLHILTKGRVSSHYLISDTGDTIYQLVDDGERAWHAGSSSFLGKTALNDSSIGIEIVSRGILPTEHKGYRRYEDYADYTPKQIEQVAALLKLLTERHGIAPDKILGHSDIAPSRKIDPGAKFPWRYLYEQHGLGAWYDEPDFQASLRVLNTLSDEKFAALDIPAIKAEFRRYGYQINDKNEWDRSSQNVIYAFQLHFRSRLPTGVLDRETLAILRALNVKYR